MPRTEPMHAPRAPGAVPGAHPRLVLKKNGAYWAAQKPRLDTVVFQAIPDESSIVAGLRTGQISLAEFSSALSFQVPKGISTLAAIQAPSTRWEVLDLAGDQ